MLLKTGWAVVNATDESERLPTAWAARNGHLVSVGTLLKAEWIEFRDKDAEGRLWYVARNFGREKRLVCTQRKGKQRIANIFVPRPAPPEYCF